MVRCPDCGRVTDGSACFACGYEFGAEPPAPATPPPASSNEEWAVREGSSGPAPFAPAAVPSALPADVDLGFDVPAATATPMMSGADEAGDFFGGAASSAPADELQLAAKMAEELDGVTGNAARAFGHVPPVPLDDFAFDTGEMGEEPESRSEIQNPFGTSGPPANPPRLPVDDANIPDIDFGMLGVEDLAPPSPPDVPLDESFSDFALDVEPSGGRPTPPPPPDDDPFGLEDFAGLSPDVGATDVGSVEMEPEGFEHNDKDTTEAFIRVPNLPNLADPDRTALFEKPTPPPPEPPSMVQDPLADIDFDALNEDIPEAPPLDDLPPLSSLLDEDPIEDANDDGLDALIDDGFRESVESEVTAPLVSKPSVAAPAVTTANDEDGMPDLFGDLDLDDPPPTTAQTAKAPKSAAAAATIRAAVLPDGTTAPYSASASPTVMAPALGDESLVDRTRTKILSARVGALAERMENEGNIEEAAILYDVQGFLDGL